MVAARLYGGGSSAAYYGGGSDLDADDGQNQDPGRCPICNLDITDELLSGVNHYKWCKKAEFEGKRQAKKGKGNGKCKGKGKRHT